MRVENAAKKEENVKLPLWLINCAVRSEDVWEGGRKHPRIF
jgi:hypothetical protein